MWKLNNNNNNDDADSNIKHYVNYNVNNRAIIKRDVNVYVE